jgi:Myb-like DNA-binding protein
MARELISRRWTAEEDAKLASLLQQGKPPAAIARSLRRTVTSIYSRRKVVASLAPDAAEMITPDERQGSDRSTSVRAAKR